MDVPLRSLLSMGFPLPLYIASAELVSRQCTIIGRITVLLVNNMHTVFISLNNMNNTIGALVMDADEQWPIHVSFDIICISTEWYLLCCRIYFPFENTMNLWYETFPYNINASHAFIWQVKISFRRHHMEIAR